MIYSEGEDRKWIPAPMKWMWTDDRVELLKKLWKDGLSGTQIAVELGGVSRNAVIGKVHRLGLSGRKSGGRIGFGIRAGITPRIRRPRSEVMVKVPKEPPPQYQRPMEEIDEEAAALFEDKPAVVFFCDANLQDCKWIPGDPGLGAKALCCGDAVIANPYFPGDPFPYCGFHANLCYRPQSRREEYRHAERATNELRLRGQIRAKRAAAAALNGG
jgi:GcrA cell cycle regulator